MSDSDLQLATLGGGCFWCLEAVYEQIDGVTRIVSGYAGGGMDRPTYEQVCSGATGHAEVVQLTFDPEVVSYRELLEIFFTIHDPTTLNRQGADTGTQYRSVIFYHDDEQRATAEGTLRDLEGQGLWSDPVVTQLKELPEFYPAESYHQGYYARNPAQPYCQAVIAPKLSKLRKSHFDRLLRKPGQGDHPRQGGQVRPFQAEPQNPLDQGGIAD